MSTLYRVDRVSRRYNVTSRKPVQGRALFTMQLMHNHVVNPLLLYIKNECITQISNYAFKQPLPKFTLAI